MQVLIIINASTDLTTWLSDLELTEYRDLFVREELYTDVLVDIREEILVNLGVSVVGHRLKILKACETLKGIIIISLFILSLIPFQRHSLRNKKTKRRKIFGLRISYRTNEDICLIGGEV
jgi:hypothetical protein